MFISRLALQMSPVPRPLHLLADIKGLRQSLARILRYRFGPAIKAARPNLSPKPCGGIRPPSQTQTRSGVFQWDRHAPTKGLLSSRPKGEILPLKGYCHPDRRKGSSICRNIVILTKRILSSRPERGIFRFKERSLPLVGMTNTKTFTRPSRAIISDLLITRGHRYR
uniref:Uncharacterized protein n=1 Tax=Candidatus Kentrum sp. MB TaxID=2138164 RepID=A0A450XQD3_9GAMM|nr:MAG: hypothetical protein BECKMB1821G_GA0114241_10825 [Candidatus Kentron sp. MB]VFK34704.1 MAG: hypothetical protein BECKMB1821I_GA0114274_10815 [Candidatus Kentron sp. MB]VFK76956.1 MAG: hypothetical protein BECKMB1821H_GA0114242_10864 [Candidatus Kentron sp. MB]